MCQQVKDDTFLCRDGSLGSGPNTFDPSEFPSLGAGSGGGGLAGRPNYGKSQNATRTHSRHLDIGGERGNEEPILYVTFANKHIFGIGKDYFTALLALTPLKFNACSVSGETVVHRLNIH